VKRVALVTAAEVPGAGPLRVIVEELGGVLITFLFLGILTMAGWVALRIQSRRRARRLAARRRERQRARARAESG
jgi:Tfp pilus assembly protein PilX